MVIRADGPLLFSFLLLRLPCDLLETGSLMSTYVGLWRVGRWMGREEGVREWECKEQVEG